MELYEAIYSRRDVREFVTDDVPSDVVVRLLDAAHHAGSVGLMQPWNFIVIRSALTRQRVAAIFAKENSRAAENYVGERRVIYDSLSTNPILDSPVHVAVTCDRNRRGPHVLGRHTVFDTDIYSTCCAIQNLWLAARAEGVGMCWMSIIDPGAVKSHLKIPDEIVLVGYLCLGYPLTQSERPLLEQVGWESRMPLEEVVFSEHWQHPWTGTAPSAAFPDSRDAGEESP